MPEEINRILCDHVSTLLFSPTQAGLDNLIKEGFSVSNQGPYHIDNPKIYHCGDVMYDNSLYFAGIAEKKTSLLKDHGLQPGAFLLSTIHRNNNTDDPVRLQAIFEALYHIASSHKIKVVLPLHPRTAKLIEGALPAGLYSSITANTWIQLLPPVSFLEMTALEKNCHMALTDSGGVQKEAFFFHKPCIIFRPETEWVELVECGSALTTDADKNRIIAAFETLHHKKHIDFPPLFGDGKAAEFICQEMLKHLS
jgi:UDP-GlcNAc3NAcA epimerase